MGNDEQALRGRFFNDARDAELLTAVRSGSSEAFAELWRRHIQAALRLAHRIAPGRADDLASDAFLAVHHQLTVAGNGPESAFRAYLFTTMRNTAVRWQKETQLVETDPDLDSVEFVDAPGILEDRARADELLEAFRALPERWQRVLWLTEVEDAARPQIAAEFGIKPNAVSALYRRARSGLRLNWLMQQVPAELRENEHHVAGLLPELVLGGKIHAPGGRVADHLRGCQVCAELRTDLIDAARRMGRTTLGALGFAGLGVVLPAASQLTATVAGAGATAALLTIGGLALAASVTVFVAIGAPTVQSSDHSQHTESSSSSDRAEAQPAHGDDSAEDRASEAGDPHDAGAGSSGAAVTGRGNIDPGLSTFSVARDSAPSDFYVTPSVPVPLSPGSSPGPAIGSSVTPPGTQPVPDGNLRPGLAPSAESGYLAPLLSGATLPGATVTVELGSVEPRTGLFAAPQQFAATVAADGQWEFDPRPLLTNQTGEWEYRVWAHTAQESSPAEVGHFTVTPLEVTGFESILPFEQLPLDEFSESGIVFRVSGPSLGTVCLTSVWPGHTVEIPLDNTGEAIRRIRFLTPGWYSLVFRVCDGEHRGPPIEFNFDVTGPDGPIFTPFGEDPPAPVFEVSEL